MNRLQPTQFPHFFPHLLRVAIALIGLTGLACAASHHPTAPADLGQTRSTRDLLRVIDAPGPVEFESIKAADWAVARSGLINLDHPTARAAGLEDGMEAIEVSFHVLRHPEFGLFIVDTGVEAKFRNPDGNDRVGFLLEGAMNTESLVVHTTTAEWLARQDQPLAGVFLTHLHLDHVMGLPDVPAGTKVFVGPGETTVSGFLNLFTRGTIDRMLASADALRVWGFEADPDGRFAALLDVFGDGSVWAIHVPGHTPGSTAFLVRSTEGAKLLVGDASHTRWGWDNGVEPGTFSHDGPGSAESLAALRSLAREFPGIEVLLGHQ